MHITFFSCAVDLLQAEDLLQATRALQTEHPAALRLFDDNLHATAHSKNDR